jgi:hypothetical protein
MILTYRFGACANTRGMPCSIWIKAFTAVSQIASKAAFTILSAESINSAPSVEVC